MFRDIPLIAYSLFSATCSGPSWAIIKESRQLHREMCTKCELFPQWYKHRFFIPNCYQNFYISNILLCLLYYIYTIGWRIWLENCATGGRMQVRFPILSLGFFIDVYFQSHSRPEVDCQPLTQKSTRDISWGVGLTTLPPLCSDLS